VCLLAETKVIQKLLKKLDAEVIANAVLDQDLFHRQGSVDAAAGAPEHNASDNENDGTTKSTSSRQGRVRNVPL
jgi:hypothetical protein